MASRERERRIDEERGEMEETNVEPRVLRMIDELPYPDFTAPYRSTVLDSEMNLWAEEFPVGADHILGRAMDEVEVERVMVFELVKDP